MGFLQKLEEAGLKDELHEIITKFLSDKGDEKSTEKLLKAVDAEGPRGKPVMRTVGSMQREKKIDPGLYKALGEFESMFEELTGGSAGEEGEVGEDGKRKRKKREKKPEVTAEDVGALMGTLNETEKKKFDDRWEKEEERVRKRLNSKKVQMIERLRNRAEGIAQRKGVSIEVAQQIKAKMDLIEVENEKVKAARVELKELRAQLKVLKPSRKRKKKKDAGEAAATGSGDGTDASVAEAAMVVEADTPAPEATA